MAKKAKKASKDDDEKSEGMSLDDAFADDEDVSYGETSKPKKEKKEPEQKLTQAPAKVTLKASKPIEQIKKGDKINIDGKEYEVDTQYILIDHKQTKEMAIELFDQKSDKDFQIRYFTDRLDVSDPELYELQNEFMYVKRFYNKLEW